MRPWTVAKACIGYFIFLAPLLLVVSASIEIAARHVRQSRSDIQAIYLTLLVALALFLLFQPWRRALWDWLKARRWRLGVWRDIFARRSASEAALSNRAHDLPTERLLACYKWPEHTEPAKAIVKQELLSRGVAADAIERWLPPPEHITVPPNAPFGSLEGWRLLEKLAFAVAQLLAVVGLAALLGALLGVLFLSAPLMITSVITMLASWGALLVVVIPIGTLTGLPATHRILLLRPFDQPAMTRTLKRIVLKHLGTAGQVFTLSDTNYRPNPFIRLGDVVATGARYALAVLLRPSIRIATVKNARTYLALAARLRGRVKPALRHFINGGQAYNIKSTNQWWQWCIDLLMHSTDAVVMDISRVSTGSAWEIDHMLVRDMLPVTIFIAQEAHEEHGREALSRIVGEASPTVFLYDAAGEFKDPAAFRSALTATLAMARRAPQNASAPAQPAVITPPPPAQPAAITPPPPAQPAAIAPPPPAPASLPAAAEIETVQAMETPPQIAAAAPSQSTVPAPPGAAARGPTALQIVAAVAAVVMVVAMLLPPRGGQQASEPLPDRPPPGSVDVGTPPPLDGRAFEMPGILLVTSDYHFFDGERGGPFGRPSYLPKSNPTRLTASGKGFSWSVVKPIPDWLYVFPESGYLPDNTTISVSIWPSSAANSLRPGTYDAHIAFRAEHETSFPPLPVAVTLTVTRR